MNGAEFDERLSCFISDLESLTPEDPLPESSLLDLEFLLSSPSSAKSSAFSDDAAFPLWSHLAAAGLSPSSLLRPLSAAMDLPSSHTSLLAARVYLSLILTPSAPVLSLFSPLAFISLLSSLRQALKPLPSPPSPDRRRKRKQGRAPRGNQRVDDSPDVGDLLPIVLDLLDSVLSRIRLDSSLDGVKSLVDTVIAILSSSTTDQHRLSGVCFRILYSAVSRPEHGDQTATAVDVLRSLARVVLSFPLKSALRTATISFIACKIAPLARENVEVRKALVYFPRYLASNAPERAEPRAATVDAILEVVRAFEKDEQIGFAEYVVKMAQGKWQLRLLAVDLILGLLTSLPDPLGVCESMESSSCWGVKCLKALLLRCSDSMGGVRARALTSMAQVIEYLSGDARNSARLQDGVAFRNAKFNELLRKRCSDEKAAVRKAALFLITKSTILMGRPIDELVLKTVGSSCMDPLVSIRKAAVSAISEVYRQFPDEGIISEWLHAVPRLTADNETSVQEECENLFLELVLDRISRASHVSISDTAKDLESILPEGVLALLKGICDGEVLPCVRKICTSLGKKKKLKPSIAISLANIISISESLCMRNCMSIERWTAPIGAWQLLSEVSLFTPKAVEWKFLLHHWKLLDKAKEDKGGTPDGEEPSSISWARDRVSLLQTISNVSVLLPPVDASDLAADLLRQIDEFNMHLSEELENSDCAALRNNILVMMVDFCVRYTALVDWYRDYVKWRGVLFLRFLLSLVDDSEKIRSLADYLFGNILKVKAPLLAYNSFIEAIFFLNGCNAYSGLSEASEKGSQLFTLSGKDEKARSQRMHIYVSLLKQMAPEHLLATSAKLCAEILAAASDGLLSIDDVTGQSVVQDCLHILACKEMRIQSSKASDTAEMDDDGGDPAGSAGATAVLAAKGRVVTHVAKKNLVQHAVPIFIELKRLLENKNSPLMGSLMDCLRVLLKDYKTEIDEILVADKQLQKELIYDMEKYEAAKAKSTVAEAMANARQYQTFSSPANRAVSGSGVFAKLSEKLGSGGKIGLAVADAAARVTAKSVLREAKQSMSMGRTLLPSKSMPRVMTSGDGRVSNGAGVQQANVLESLRRRKMFVSDDDED
ncbi:hypothetical protein KFK09_006061 [Dendrobium nobile]|uniref:Condensin complex subunit 1 C-terminal domain-containing protein n=1 Tax=Dendrobium nobile TaxID=94219 RepID=A0A8T3BMU2_DENNO|nr:hypothetical protein KFK09_006061 [Dendrobium nobile]